MVSLCRLRGLYLEETPQNGREKRGPRDARAGLRDRIRDGVGNGCIDPMYATRSASGVHCFLNAIEAQMPTRKLVHVILDNYAVHKHPKVRQ
jgi:hypothetical protein